MKTLKTKLLLAFFISCFFLFGLAGVSEAATYFVKPASEGGSDGNIGLSDAQAWATIAKVNDYAENPGFSDGDVICLKRGSVWSNDEPIGWDGSLINWGTINGLTIQDYGLGALPRLDANTQQPIVIASKTISNLVIKNIDISGMDWTTQGNWAKDSHLRVHEVDGLIIDGIYCDGHVGASSYNNHAACIAITNVDGNIEVKNCTLKNMYKDTFANTVSDWGELDSSGIFFWYEVANTPKLSGTVSIHDNLVNNVYSDCIAPEGIQTTTNIYNNTLLGWGENAIESKGGRYHNIYNNDISWNNFGVSKGAAYWGGNLWSGMTSFYWPGYPVGDHTFHDNYIHDSALVGVRLTTSLPVSIYNNYFKDVGNAVILDQGNNNMSIYNNLIVMKKDAATPPVGHAMENAVFRTAITLRAGSNTNIYNNSIYISSSNHDYGIYVYSNPGAGSKIMNNIVQMTRNSPSVYPLYSAGSAANVSYNDWHGSHSNRTYWNGTTYDNTEQIAWKTDGHAGALFTNPNFVNPSAGDLTLQSTSPAINAGTNLGAPYNQGLNSASTWPNNVSTLNQNDYGNWEIGAFVYADVPPATCVSQSGTCCSPLQTCEGGSSVSSSDCATVCCVGGTCEDAEICNDLIDNDGDGDIDCADADCSADPACGGPPPPPPPPTCQNQGYQCCAFCQSGPHPKYNSNCSGQRCCDTCIPTIDIVPPSIPTNLKSVASVTVPQITLSWSVSYDNVGVAGYNIYRDGVKIATSRFAFYKDYNNISYGTAYTYTVSAYDAAGNESAQSESVTDTSNPLGTTIEKNSSTSDFPAIVANFLQWSLSIAGALSLLILIIGGMMFMASSGDEQKLVTSKKTIICAVAGLFLILMAYVIVAALDII